MSLVATNPKYYFRRDVHDINQVRKGIIYVFSFCLNVEQKNRDLPAFGCTSLISILDFIRLYFKRKIKQLSSNFNIIAIRINTILL